MPPLPDVREYTYILIILSFIQQSAYILNNYYKTVFEMKL